jgi:hypothetical protein
MRKKFSTPFVGLFMFIALSCGHLKNAKDVQSTENRILQQEDGTVFLKLDKAGFYYDMANPSNNTADWNVVISKPGRFKVWLSSATKDTSDLKYTNSVRISLLDDQLEAKPACDKIVQNTNEVQYPYFRADSYMGSVYVSEPGEYNIQVISEKITSNTTEFQSTSLADDTKLMSVILMPVTN